MDRASLEIAKACQTGVLLEPSVMSAFVARFCANAMAAVADKRQALYAQV